mmetsp:Transcript_20325/g.51174  ORF Transcript_20325/g.51174 Transcript_20325/m.51174 type:complete len:406 (-) Transcript_20325:224-1441(-)
MRFPKGISGPVPGGCPREATVVNGDRKSSVHPGRVATNRKAPSAAPLKDPGVQWKAMQELEHCAIHAGRYHATLERMRAEADDEVPADPDATPRQDLQRLHLDLARAFYKDAAHASQAFVQSAEDVLQAASIMEKPKWRRNLSALSTSIRARSKGPRPLRHVIGQSAEAVLAAACACLAFALACKDGVRAVEAAYRAATGGARRARLLVEPCWNDARLGTFLTSPLLDELRALVLLHERGFPGQSCSSRSGDAPEVTCAICLGTLFRPVGLVCGHVFCGNCVRASLEHKRPTDVEERLASRLANDLTPAGATISCAHCRRASRLSAARPMPCLEALARAESPAEWAEQRQRHAAELAELELERQERHSRRVQERLTDAHRAYFSLHSMLSAAAPLHDAQLIIPFL